MVEFNDKSTYSLDHELSASVKKILLKQITFKDAQIPDEGDMLSHKYKPLNGRYNNLQHGNSTSRTNQVSKNSSAQSDIPTPPTVIFPAEKVELEWKEMKRIGPGLANLGNTCFLNSVLQVLTYTPPLVNYMLSGYHKSKCRIVGFCMQCELLTHINRVLHQHSQMSAIRPMSIIQKLQCIGKNFRFGRQEDAHEFLRYVVEGIQKSDYADKPKLDKLSKETTVANAIFGGFYRSQVKCLHCNYESNTFDPMMDLNMDIKDCSTIIQTFQKSVRPDRLDGENKYFCEKCRTKRVAQKRGNIHKEPNILTLVLKRFDFSKMFGGKISKEVTFTEELNIRPFMSNPQGEPVFYKLYGILVHSGYSCNSGHYYCYVKAAHGTWYEMNDSRVCQVGLQTVLRAQAYILFYVKKGQGRTNLINNHTSVPNNNPVNGIIRNLPKPELRSSGSPRKESLGLPVKRKPEPKINWIHNQKDSTAVKNAGSLSSVPSNIKNSDENKGKSLKEQKQNTAKLPLNNTNLSAANTEKVPPSTAKLPLLGTAKLPSPDATKLPTSHTAKLPTPDKPITLNIQKKVVAKSTSMNGLQKLSESYEDSDGVESRASSPAPNKKEDCQLKQNENEATQTIKENLVDDKNSNQVEKESISNKNETHESKHPFKLTLKTGKQFIHNKLNIWSPITKGTLYPRAILNKCIIDNEGDQPKVHFSSKKKKIVDSTWKEESISTPEKLFGPLMPPPPGTKCQGSNSITSETSSTGSIQTQSGEWDVLEKGCEASAPTVPDFQPAGWNVSSTAQSLLNTSGNDSLVITSDIESKLIKKKKKKKKKRKHHSEDRVELKQEVRISIDKIGANQELSLSDAKLENTVTHDGKNKKVQLQSTISLPLIPSLSADEIYRKKQKKKKKRYSLLIDANTNNIGKIYNVPCDIEKYFSKHKAKNNSDTTYNDNYKNIPSKVVKNYSTSLTSSPVHVTVGKERTHEKVKSLNAQSQQRTAEQNIDKSVKDYSMNNSLAQHEDRHLYTLSSVVGNSNNGNNPPSKSSSVSSFTNHHKGYSQLQDPRERNTAESQSTHSISEGNRAIKSVVTKEESSSARKREVPTHVWDDTKKKHFSWDGSNKSDTMEHLLSSGPKVNSWDGSNKSYFYNMKRQAENPQDEWDEEYDRGKVKKKKRKADDDYDDHKSKYNCFQDYQNYKNYNNDKHSHRSSKHRDHKHHSKKHKTYSESNRYV